MKKPLFASAARWQFEIAMQMLGDSAMDVRQITSALDYADASAFRRAFRRWSNTTRPGGGREAGSPEVRVESAPRGVRGRPVRRDNGAEAKPEMHP